MLTIGGIYLIYNKVNGKRYIGGSNNLCRRKIAHLSSLKLNKHGNPRLQEDFNVYGEDAFEFIALRYIDNENEIFDIEEDWINWCKPEYNSVLPEDNNIPKSARTPEARKKISETVKRLHREGVYKNRRPVVWKAGYPNRLGVKLSDETKRKISCSLMGKKHPGYGKPRSNKTRERISAGHKQEYSGAVSPDGEVFAPIINMTRFCKTRNLTAASMCSVMKDRRKSHKGWIKYNG